jgi:nucleotidyltransferase substrate binding protein (TIGR01987 family)
MLEKADLKVILNQFQKAINQFDLVLKEDVKTNPIVLDASIQRFELCFEICWKSLKRVLFFEGIDAKSPRHVFQESFKLGWLSDGDAFWTQMIKDRNNTVHTYNQDLAMKIYSALPSYLKAYKHLHEVLLKKV